MSVIIILRTWIHCLYPISSLLGWSTLPVGCWYSWASGWLRWGVPWIPCQQPPFGRLLWQLHAYPPKTLGRGQASPERRRPWPSNRTSPSCSSHLLSSSTDSMTHLRFPCWYRSPRQGEVSYSWCSICTTSLGSSSHSCTSHSVSVTSSPLLPCSLQQRMRRCRSSSWNRHHSRSRVWLTWDKPRRHQTASEWRSRMPCTVYLG